MWVDRRVFRVKKQEYLQEAVELLKGLEIEGEGETWSYRVLVPEVGTYDTMVLEIQYESFDQFRSIMAKWNTTPERDAFFKRWWELTEPQSTSEIWRVA